MEMAKQLLIFNVYLKEQRNNLFLNRNLFVKHCVMYNNAL